MTGFNNNGYSTSTSEGTDDDVDVHGGGGVVKKTAADDSSSFDPLGPYIREILQNEPRQVIQRADFVELLQVSVVPGACSTETATLLHEYIERDDNVAEIIDMLLTEPEIRIRNANRDAPTYNEYALNYNAFTVLCLHRFSNGIAKQLFPTQFTPSRARNVILARLSDPNPFDPIVAEAFSRFLTETLDQRPFDIVIRSLGMYWEELLEGMLYHMGSPPLYKIALRLFQQPPGNSPLDIYNTLASQLVQQLFPRRALTTAALVLSAPEAYQDQLQIRTYDFVFWVLNQDATEANASLATRCIQVLETDEGWIQQLLDGCLEDLADAGPRECYSVKVLNLLLQQSTCGCVVQDDDDASDSCRGESTTPPRLWTHFIQRLDRFLPYLEQSHGKPRFSLSQLQMINLVLPMIQFECCAVDAFLLQNDILPKLLAYMIQFKNANILHAAVTRVFQLTLEQRTAANDRLRQSIVKSTAIVSSVMAQFDHVSSMIEIARLLDQHSSELCAASEWDTFRQKMLAPCLQAWDTSANFQHLPVTGAVYAVQDAERDLSSSSGGSGGEKKKRKDSMNLLLLAG